MLPGNPVLVDESSEQVFSADPIGPNRGSNTKTRPLAVIWGSPSGVISNAATRLLYRIFIGMLG